MQRETRGHPGLLCLPVRLTPEQEQQRMRAMGRAWILSPQIEGRDKPMGTEKPQLGLGRAVVRDD